MPDSERLRALAATVGAFYITDRAMKRAQASFAAALAAGEPSAAETDAYLRAVRTYFTAFESEARAHVSRIDREFKRLHQLQFNLTAERGVAAKRVEATQGVLAALAETAAL